MSSGSIFTPFVGDDLIPKEEKLEVFKKKKKVSIGIPKEISLQERRLCITPDAVEVLVANGYRVLVESGAGKGSFFSDMDYSEAGAQIVEQPMEVFKQDLVLKINPPTLDEIQYLKMGGYLISALQVNLQGVDYFRALSEKKITAIAFEFIEDEYGQLPLVRLIGEIAGRISITHAAELLSLSTGQILGGVTGVRPSEVVVIGAGIVGEFATKAAQGFGANVRVFDHSLYRLRRLQTMVNIPVSTSILEPKELTKMLRRADVVIGALPRLNTGALVTESMVMKMKKGSVVVDLTIDNGKVFETSELNTMENQFSLKCGVVHSALANITSKIPKTTTKALSNFFLNYILKTEDEGGFENMLHRNKQMKNSLYMYKGRYTNREVCEYFGLFYYDINLLIL